eukprot:TRINITY_DN18538_c0_g1_i1.p1 TRINITY_DN18538_c0_g1~~TRINITY_DN18538_c0_g1_i1.p1  ORF type:complete len:438 (-),score=66.31 TRINITY_DN18538_c0_g1_i1:27-1340(-)
MLAGGKLILQVVILLFVLGLIIFGYQSTQSFQNMFGTIKVNTNQTSDPVLNFSDSATCPSSALPPLKTALESFDFSIFEGLSLADPLPPPILEKYQNFITPYLEQEPSAPLIVKKRPNSLRINCADGRHSSFLTGKPRKVPIRIYDTFPFAYELDLLEVRLYELSEVVDMFFLAEATYTHRFTKKSLFFARHKERFRDFQEKLVHVVMDDPTGLRYHRQSNESERDQWNLEKGMRRLLWDKLEESGVPISPEDLILHGDLDEIPSAEVLAYMKHCRLRKVYNRAPFAFIIPHYVNNFDWFNVNSTHINFPIVYPGGVYISSNNGFERGTVITRGVWGGWHCNRFGSNVLRLYKHLSLAEGGNVPRGDLNILKDPELIETFVAAGQRECCVDEGRVHPEKWRSIPWVVWENQQRFRSMLPLRPGNAWTDLGQELATPS